MKTNNVGGFIQQLRKDKGMTQKELAEIIGMSDKTISKWESGNSLPDTSVLVSLCEALDISVNELLSCEKIPPEDYSKKAEENIMTLMKENEENQKANVLTKIIGIVIGIALLVVGIFMFLVSNEYGYAGLTEYPLYFIDIHAMIFIVLFEAGIILISGERSKTGILSLIGKTIIPIGTVVSLATAVILFGSLYDPHTIGPNLAVTILALIYSCIIKIVVELMLAKQSQ